MLSEKAKKCKNSRIFKIGSALLSIKKEWKYPKIRAKSLIRAFWALPTYFFSFHVNRQTVSTVYHKTHTEFLILSFLFFYLTKICNIYTIFLLSKYIHLFVITIKKFEFSIFLLIPLAILSKWLLYAIKILFSNIFLIFWKWFIRNSQW